MTVGLDEMKRELSFEHNVGLTAASPGSPVAKMTGATSEQKAEAFIEHMKDNLVFWLHDQIPEEIRSRSKLWYEGANRIAHEMSDKYKVNPASSAAALAALSPQKDWFQNVSLAQRVHEIHFNQRDTRFSPEMLKTSKEIYAKPQYRQLVRSIANKKYGELEDPVERRRCGCGYGMKLTTRKLTRSSHRRDTRVQM